MLNEVVFACGVIFACSCSLLVLAVVVWLTFNALCKSLGLTAAVVSLIVHRPILRFLCGERPSTACFVCGRNCCRPSAQKDEGTDV